MLIASGLFDRREVGALQVFNERQLHRLFVVGLDDDDGHLAEPRHARSAPSSFACDDLIVAGVQKPDGQRLNDAVLPDGVRQRSQLFLVEALARLEPVRLDFLKREQKRALLGAGLHRTLTEQRAKSLPETFICGHVQAPFVRISCVSAS